MVGLLKCIFGPALQASYHNGPNLQACLYKPNTAEVFADMVVRSVSLLMSIVKYVTIGLSPFVVSYMRRNGYFSREGGLLLAKYAAGVLVLYYCAVFVRGVGRFLNRDYMVFRQTLENAAANDANARARLQYYDFDFKYWKVDFNVTSLASKEKPEFKKFAPKGPESWLAAPIWYLTKVIAMVVGRPLIYPGSLGVMQSAIGPALAAGRYQYIMKDGARRVKLGTWNGNEIDAMVIDSRNKTENGKTLVVCCEGNAGFYEVGLPGTPMQNGYSILGWNHPGFGGSTGLPYPAEEQDAMDTVMQYAINGLGFKPEDIVIFAWSIGGYPASWAAREYPDAKAVIMDASFDDILPLALPHMPQFLSGVVRLTIRNHFNLKIADQLNGYSKGPVLFIRRSLDEIIATDPNNVSTNRGNYLALKFLSHRYPRLMTAQSVQLLHQYLGTSRQSKINEILTEYQYQEHDMEALIAEHKEKHGADFPSTLDAPDGDSRVRGQLALFLLKKHFVDYDSTHCTPLPKKFFVMPWDYRQVEMPY